MVMIDEFEFPDDLFYDTKEHMWLRPDRTRVTAGIDDGGQDALGDVVYVQLTGTGKTVTRGEAIGSIEAEKMVRPLLAPVSGKLVEVNQDVVTRPRLVNDDPYGAWLFRIEASDWNGERTHFAWGREAVTEWVNSELAAHGRK